MHVICKKCGEKIIVAEKPTGSTNVEGVNIKGNVVVKGGGISFGPGGSIAFGPGGSLSFGSPTSSEFICTECGHSAIYDPTEIKEA